jgi:serine/threonine-protein kinase
VLDGKADVYALALVLYEGVTGQAAFVGDTTVATLMARVDALLPEHQLLGPLNDVLVWAAAPDPDERYDAATLGLKLKELAATLPAPELLPLVAPVTVEPTVEARVRPTGRSQPRLDGDDITELGVPPVAPLARPRSGDVGPIESTTPSDPGHRRWPWVVAIAVVVAALVAAAVVFVVDTKLFTPSHPVPALVGKTVAAANRSVAADHFTVHQTGEQHSITLAAGLIVSQHPTPGAGKASKPVTAKQGTTIDVVVSSGPPSVAIPSLTAFSSCSNAVQALKAVHLVGVCPASAAQYSSTVASGGILGSTPASSAPYGSTVTIAISKGPAPIPVPSIPTSDTYAQAEAALKAAGFAVAEAQGPNASVPSGQVVDTSPAAGAMATPGSTVTVNVSTGPPTVAVPNLGGDSVTAATAALQAVGLSVGTVYGPAQGTVFDSIPASGTTVNVGSPVTLYTAGG